MERLSIPSTKEMRNELRKANFSPDFIRQQGVEVLYRGHIAQQKPDFLKQMGSLKCDADSQDPRGAMEDLFDLLEK